MGATVRPRTVGLITIAAGPSKYVDFARGLGASLRNFDRLQGSMAIVTDRPASVFDDLFDVVIPIDEAMGSGVEQKLSLDRLTPFDETLFVDCDCLVFRDLAPTMGAFRASGLDFGVLGGHHIGAEDEHYAMADVGAYLEALDIERLPAFNSGMIWWVTEGARVFEEARKIAASDTSGVLNSFKGARLADEPVLGAAMERLGLGYSAARSEHMLPTVAATSLRGIDVVAGRSTVPTDRGSTTPAVLHFNFDGQDSRHYARERWRTEHPAIPTQLATIASAPRWARRHGKAAVRRYVKARLR